MDGGGREARAGAAAAKAAAAVCPPARRTVAVAARRSDMPAAWPSSSSASRRQGRRWSEEGRPYMWLPRHGPPPCPWAACCVAGCRGGSKTSSSLRNACNWRATHLKAPHPFLRSSHTLRQHPPSNRAKWPTPCRASTGGRLLRRLPPAEAAGAGLGPAAGRSQTQWRCSGKAACEPPVRGAQWPGRGPGGDHHRSPPLLTDTPSHSCPLSSARLLNTDPRLVPERTGLYSDVKRSGGAIPARPASAGVCTTVGASHCLGATVSQGKLEMCLASLARPCLSSCQFCTTAPPAAHALHPTL